MTRRVDPGSDLVSTLLDSIGGAERIRSVRTFLRETVRSIRHAEGGPATKDRVLTFRAAGGRLRIETRPFSAGSGHPPVRSGRLIVTPAGRSTDRSRNSTAPSDAPLPGAAAGGGSSSLDEAASASSFGGAASASSFEGIQSVSSFEEAQSAASDEAESALRDARLEPRNLLAHLQEKAHIVRRAPGGAIEIELAEEQVLYRFDSRTGLCLVREDARARAVTRYGDWRRVARIASPFVEIHEQQGSTTESRVVGIAYDLQLPGLLFTA